MAEILPLESADMRYHTISQYNLYPCDEIVYTIDFGKPSDIDTPCWSLAALLDLLPYPQLSKDKIGADKIGWMVSVYPDNCRDDSYWHNNLVDACYEMIIKLHKQKLL